jgi:hypothetical protein
MAARRPPRPRLDLTAPEVWNVTWQMFRCLREQMQMVVACRESLAQPGHHLAWLYTPKHLVEREQEVAATRLSILKLMEYGRQTGLFHQPPADMLAEMLDRANKRDAEDAQKEAARRPATGIGL